MENRIEREKEEGESSGEIQARKKRQTFVERTCAEAGLY